MRSIKQIVTIACKYEGITYAELARRLKITPQTLSRRLNSGRFTLEELDEIAHAINMNVVMYFQTHDGEKIG